MTLPRQVPQTLALPAASQNRAPEDAADVDVALDLSLISGAFAGATIIGADGDDHLIGTDGDDEIGGGDGDDDIFGLDGDDVIRGGEGQDFIDGGDGDDSIDGEAGDDDIYGGEGDDGIIVGHGDDEAWGEAGDDTFFVNSFIGSNILDGGAGVDTLVVKYAPGVIVNMFAGLANRGANGSDSFSNIENVETGAGADSVVGDDGANKITTNGGADGVSGLGGDDDISTGSGDDTVDGGADDDLIDGGSGDDTLAGGSGDDEIRGGAGDNAVDGGSGWDQYVVENPIDVQIVLNGAGDGFADRADGYDTLESIEMIKTIGDGQATVISARDDMTVETGGGGNAVVAGDGDDWFEGGDGVDIVVGGGDDDFLRGRGDDDMLMGGHGDDAIIGGVGADLLWGGQGIDHFVYSAGDYGIDVIYDFEIGVDQIAFGPGFLADPPNPFGGSYVGEVQATEAGNDTFLWAETTDGAQPFARLVDVQWWDAEAAIINGQLFADGDGGGYAPTPEGDEDEGRVDPGLDAPFDFKQTPPPGAVEMVDAADPWSVLARLDDGIYDGAREVVVDHAFELIGADPAAEADAFLF